jgi:outer membrane protein
MFCALALFVDCAAAQPLKIGYIDTFRIENESVQALKAMEGLKKEFQPRQKRVEDLQKEIAAARDQLAKEGARSTPAEQRARERTLAAMISRSDQERRALTEDLELRKNQERAKIIEETNIVIKSLAEAGKYDLIVQQAIFSSRAIDMTDRVLKALAKRAAAR